MNRRTTILSFIAAAIFAVCLPGLASAQSNDPWWGRDRDRRSRDDGYYGRYDERTLRDAAQRIKNRARDLERDVDRYLDNSRQNGTRREDRVNEQAQEFRRAADRFKDRVGNGRDLNRSADEARELISRANQIDRVLGRGRVDSRVYSDWSSINQDLRLVADIYGLRYNGGGYNNGGYYPDDRRYPNDRDRRNNNDDWWRRIPGVRWP
ncbi:MAG TPA: hypothetical protein VF546_04825 [Pyrinomonadaceae bacterium]|jgi:hypothetical protein